MRGLLLRGLLLGLLTRWAAALSCGECPSGDLNTTCAFPSNSSTVYECSAGSPHCAFHGAGQVHIYGTVQFAEACLVDFVVSEGVVVASGALVTARSLVVMAGSIEVQASAELKTSGMGPLLGPGSTSNTAHGASYGGSGGRAVCTSSWKGYFSNNDTTIGTLDVLRSWTTEAGLGDPTLGSGGGSDGGGRGGGRVLLNATTVTVDGSVQADGSAGSAAGSGSGGSIAVIADDISGTGSLSARGGAGEGTAAQCLVQSKLPASCVAAGGGGRIYIRARQLDDEASVLSTDVSGGSLSSSSTACLQGGAGTVFQIFESVNTTQVVVSNGDAETYAVTRVDEAHVGMLVVTSGAVVASRELRFDSGVELINGVLTSDPATPLKGLTVATAGLTMSPGTVVSNSFAALECASIAMANSQLETSGMAVINATGGVAVTGSGTDLRVGGVLYVQGARIALAGANAASLWMAARDSVEVTASVVTTGGSSSPFFSASSQYAALPADRLSAADPYGVAAQVDYNATVLVEAGGNITVSGSSVQATTVWLLSLTAVVVDETSTLTAAGLGFPASTGPGAGSPTSSTIGKGGGGGYGGAGGDAGSTAGGDAYGSETGTPDWGSGGGSEAGGAGGGVVIAEAAQVLQIDGEVTASGAAAGGFSGGGGSGGHVLLAAQLLMGGGTVSAAGGAGGKEQATAGAGGGGGGGRVQVVPASKDGVILADDFVGSVTSGGGAAGGSGASSGDDGSVVPPSCSAGFGFDGAACAMCLPGTFSDSVSAGECETCHNSKPDHAFWATGISEDPTCTFICEDGRVGDQCQTVLERFLDNFGGVWGFLALAAGALLLLLAGSWWLRWVRARRAAAEAPQAEEGGSPTGKTTAVAAASKPLGGRSWSFARDAAAAHCKKLIERDLPAHAGRVYLAGDNTPLAPLRLPLQAPAQILPIVIEAEWALFATRVNEAARFSWRTRWVLLAAATLGFPLFAAVLRRYRRERVHRVRAAIGKYDHAMLRGTRARTLMDCLRFNASPDMTLAYVDLLFTETNVPPPPVLGAPALPLVLLFAGTGAYDAPFFVDTNDIMVQAVSHAPVLSRFIDAEWIAHVAAINARARVVRGADDAAELVAYAAEVNAEVDMGGLVLSIGRFYPAGPGSERLGLLVSFSSDADGEPQTPAQAEAQAQAQAQEEAAAAERRRLFASSSSLSPASASALDEPIRRSIRDEALRTSTDELGVSSGSLPGLGAGAGEPSEDCLGDDVDLGLPVPGRILQEADGGGGGATAGACLAALLPLRNKPAARLKRVLTVTVVLLLLADAVGALTVLADFWCVPSPDSASACDRDGFFVVLMLYPLAVVVAPILGLVAVLSENAGLCRSYARWNVVSVLNAGLALDVAVRNSQYVLSKMTITAVLLAVKVLLAVAIDRCIGALEERRTGRGWFGLSTTVDDDEAAAAAAAEAAALAQPSQGASPTPDVEQPLLAGDRLSAVEEASASPGRPSRERRSSVDTGGFKYERLDALR